MLQKVPIKKELSLFVGNLQKIGWSVERRDYFEFESFLKSKLVDNQPLIADTYDSVFGGKMRTEIRNEVGFILPGGTEEIFQVLLLNVETGSVKSGLEKYFEPEERILGSPNQKIVGQQFLVEPPKVLNLFVNRIIYDRAKSELDPEYRGEVKSTNPKKSEKPFLLEKTIDLAPFLDPKHQTLDTVYRLVELIVYEGPINKGKYYSLLKSRPWKIDDDAWYSVDGENIAEVSEKDVLRHAENSYMLTFINEAHIKELFRMKDIESLRYSLFLIITIAVGGFFVLTACGFLLYFCYIKKKQQQVTRDKTDISLDSVNLLI